MKLPKDLGDVEFLRNHPTILKMLIERSSAKSLDPFIKNRRASVYSRGFSWRFSQGGWDFWDEVLGEKNPDHFYTLYPKGKSSAGRKPNPDKKVDKTFKIDRDLSEWLKETKYNAAPEVNAFLREIKEGS